MEITVNIYIYFCIFGLSALNKILFPYVFNYGSKGRDAVKNSISNSIFTPFSILTIQLPLQYRLLLIMYRSLIITARMLLITAVCYLSWGYIKVTGYVKIAHVTPVSITVLIIHSQLHLGQVPFKALRVRLEKFSLAF